MIRPFGEAAVLVEVASPDAAQSLAASLRRDPPSGVAAVVPGLASVLVEAHSGADMSAIRYALERRAEDAPDAPPAGRPHRIRVLYGGEAGPDLDEVARTVGLTADEVVARHAATELRVLFMGFAPGFAYLGDLPDELDVPRLATPRSVTPTGSVAIAGRMSGIYPAALPGGWPVIGRTEVRLFDPRADPPTLLQPGDRVRFEPASDR